MVFNKFFLISLGKSNNDGTQTLIDKLNNVLHFWWRSMDDLLLDWLRFTSFVTLKSKPVKPSSDTSHCQVRDYSPAKLSLGVADQPNGQRLVSTLIRLRPSVTRFGEISPLRQNVKKPWQFFEGWFNVWHCLNLLWLINYDNNQFFIVRIAKSKKIILPSGHIAQSQVLIPCS